MNNWSVLSLIIYLTASLYLIIDGRDILFYLTKEDWYDVLMDIVIFFVFLIIAPIIVCWALLDRGLISIKRWWHRH